MLGRHGFLQTQPEAQIMVRSLRRIGIAIGSFVIAWLAISLVAGVLLGEAASRSELAGFAALILGGLVYVDILRRERSTP